MRLLYYFPKESAPLLAKRVDELKMLGYDAVKDNEERDAANGLVTLDFINAISWSKAPEVRAALTRFCARTKLLEDVYACLPAIDESEVIREYYESLLPKLEGESLPYNNAQSILAHLLNETPKSAREAMENYMKDREPRHCRTVCLALQLAIGDWDVPLLAPLLGDTRDTPDDTNPLTNDDAEQPAGRVCDYAAWSLANNHPEFTFNRKAGLAERDKQITEILAKIGLK